MLPTEKAYKGGILKDPDSAGEYLRICNNSKYPYFQLKPQHLYFTSDREIKEGEWMYSPKDNTVYCASNMGILAGDFKIEATTNSSMNIPPIPTSFIKKYVESQGIKEVMIEMTNTHVPDGWNHEVPKLRKDGTIIVHKIKDSWTREEVIELIKRNTERLTNQWLSNDIEWIEQNL
ncbi:MAG: hypothetical protein WC479_07885 [Candidatus Izemoplasmatales bacterium]